MEPRSRFRSINSASLFSLAGRYDNPIPTRCQAPIDFLKIPALIFITFSQPSFSRIKRAWRACPLITGRRRRNWMRRTGSITATDGTSFTTYRYYFLKNNTKTQSFNSILRRLKMEVISPCHVMCTAVLIGRDPATTPIPPHLDSYTRALLVSKDRRHLFVTLCYSSTM